MLLATCFLVLPLQAHKGVLGLQLGSLTPALVLFYNAVWGVAAGWWLSLVQENQGSPIIRCHWQLRFLPPFDNGGRCMEIPLRCPPFS